ncbi:MAG: UDP-N-acetylglucosamine 1-carboxyvinyltransferase [Candidatus Sungbacteria bacterium]|nr:UDP-N-acetylglucosamine 1-carboxyvinyltransferase [Candidatus Sungbacteria bacterium]
MTAQFIINGGKPLSGSVTIQGSKNTALPLIAASLMTREPVVLENVPDIADVEVMFGIAKSIGSHIEWDASSRRLRIRTRHITGDTPDDALCRKLRGSILFSGALVGRTGSAAIAYPGGDAIGARPLTTHAQALKKLGVVVEEGERIRFDAKKAAGADLTLEEPSVTATENTILAALGVPGRTIIRLAACEPHVQELVAFLRDMGADIAWISHGRIALTGGKELRGARRRINPDEVEVSSFAALAAATRSEFVLKGINPEYLDSVFLQLETMGVACERSSDEITIKKPERSYRNFRVQSGLYPKLGSDHLPLFAVLATQAEGTSLIHDWLYENRLRYVPELQKMGADCVIVDPHRVLITGPTPLRGCAMAGLDIRSGMTLIVASLVAEGASVIAQAEHIDRGYERIDERLRELGADIRRV